MSMILQTGFLGNTISIRTQATTLLFCWHHLFLEYVCRCFAYMYVYVCLLPVEAIRRQASEPPWKCRLWALIWVLGVNSRSSGKQPVLLTIELSPALLAPSFIQAPVTSHRHCHSGLHSPPQIASRPSIFGCTYPFPIQRPHSLLCHVHYAYRTESKPGAVMLRHQPVSPNPSAAVLMSCCVQHPHLPRVPLDDSVLLHLISILYLQTIPGPVRGRYLINLK